MGNWMWVALGILVIGGVLLFTNMNNQTSRPQVGIGGGPGAVSQPKSMEVRLNPVNKDQFDQSGNVLLQENNGKVAVILNVNPVDGLNDQPAHIHIGSCPGVGQVLFPLNNVVDGKSVTEINTTIDQLKSKAPLAINIHKSPSEITAYTTCGNLSQ